MSGTDGSGCTAHAAALFESGDDLRRRVVPFVRDGLAAGESVVAVVSGRAAAQLRRGLGADERDIRWQVPDVSYRSLGPMYNGLRRYLAGQYEAGNRIRLIAENDTTSSAARTAAYLRFEAASNHVLGTYGFPWVCLYDRRRHSPDVLDAVRQVHPLLVGSDGRSAPSSDYVPPETYLRAHPGPLSVVPPEPPVDFWVTTVGQFGAARRAVAEAGGMLGLTEETGDDFELATAEALSNALRHGERPCRIRVWATPHHVVMRVDDQGLGDDITTKGFHPPDPANVHVGGMGVWMIRQLADVVHIRVGAAGTAVEVQFPRPPALERSARERQTSQS
ncbi:anti-sigma regulatory factor (Ser/Thr protein kinase) [Pseudonocardia hierapolitana]|uniref:Anti-sigma regulatory factor (Ser/Thr protein kinase) n=1 Tax=Pseudonocardia hierapolitana TaxID=1128676 RepID=A0A561SKG8_9PSEU|nr:sensor histidine kinase [Pseudonocardia hierapolitana]TWF75348.1 anti-sigma regulatory factor (Ser/Thr protein kinase) [Pseudonocardia hierapolitana]